MAVVVAGSQFSEWLQQQLDDRGWAIGDLAARSEIPYQTIYSWMKDGRVASKKHTRPLAKTLGVDPDVVRFHTGERDEPGAQVLEEAQDPPWVAELITSLREMNLSAEEVELIEGARLGLFRFRERQGGYHASTTRRPRAD